MSRLDIKTASKAQTVVDRLYKDMERRIASSPPGLCPIDMSLTFLQLCHAQSCGKCVPCRIGLGQLSALMGQVLDGTGTMTTVDTIEKTARAIVASADCAIGRDAAQLVLSGFEGFRDDYVNHVKHHRCLASLQNPVPCVSLCPAGVDVPGYVALVREGRYADAVRLIRKDNPMPTACAYICEHPCEARCRRNMVDAPINIRGPQALRGRPRGRCSESSLRGIYRQACGDHRRRSERPFLRVLSAPDGSRRNDF